VERKRWVVLNADGSVDEEQSNKNLELYRTEKIHLIKRLILELPKVTR
jgi:hypothetical protein